MADYDLVVIGAGSGLDVANAAAEAGLSVAIVEKDRMGGTCLNRGCIPSKLLIHSADVAETIRAAATFGIDVKGYSVDFERIIARMESIVDPESEGILQAFGQVDNPKLYHEEARFVGLKRISVGSSEITGKKFLIATGTRPRIPKIPGLTDFLTSDEALRLKKQPAVLTIIGGGYIAAEMAHFFGALGTKINIIQRRPVLLPAEDEQVSAKFSEVFSRRFSVHLGHDIESVSKDAGAFTVRAKSASGTITEICSDQLLVSAGRVPNSDTLNLPAAGVQTDDRGFIKVDEYLETTAEGIFALGDAVGRYLFKHSANHEAQYAFNNIVSQEKAAVDYTAMPHAVFSSPQVAGVGATEQELKRKGLAYKKSVYPYIKTAMGEAIDDKDGFVKILVSEEGRILGCHIMGADAATLIHEVIVAMKLGASVQHLAGVVHIHPALSEVVSRAAGSL